MHNLWWSRLFEKQTVSHHEHRSLYIEDIKMWFFGRCEGIKYIWAETKLRKKCFFFLLGVTEMADTRGPFRAGGLYRDPLPAQKKWISKGWSSTITGNFSIHASFVLLAFCFMLKSFSFLSPCKENEYLTWWKLLAQWSCCAE